MESTPSLIDIGVNLTNSRFKQDLEDVLIRSQSKGVNRWIITGTSESASAKAVEICQSYPDYQLYATCGIHPHDAASANSSTWKNLEDLAASPHVVSIGETGLDFNRDFSPRPVQIKAFEAQLELAIKLGLPVFLHERDAHQTFFEIIKSCRSDLVNGVVHCFTGNRQALFNYLDLDLHIGITGWVCDERRGKDLQNLVHNIPLNRLMLETDSPYLTPRTLKPKPKNGRNEPAFLPYVLNQVAQCMNKPAAEIAQQTTETAQRFFKLPV